jgi:hypothetical protein
MITEKFIAATLIAFGLTHLMPRFVLSRFRQPPPPTIVCAAAGHRRTGGGRRRAVGRRERQGRAVMI